MDDENMPVDPEETEEVSPSPETEEKDEKSISSDLIRGHINTIILRALYDGDKYGYAIIAEIERKSHGQYSLKQPSLYSALKRLEKDGYVTSYWGGSVGGGRRKYFSLTEEGKEIAETNQAEWEYSRTVIDSLISDKEFDFANPAPSAVNMRVLRSSTSRVPNRGEDGEELDYEPNFDDSAERDAIKQELEAEYDQRALELENERKSFAEEIETERQNLAQQLEAQRLSHEQELEEVRRNHEQQLEEERQNYEQQLREERESHARELEEERKTYEERIESDRLTETHELESRRQSLTQEFESERRDLEAQRQIMTLEMDAQRRNLARELEAQKQSAAAEIEEARKTLESERQAASDALEEERRNFEAEKLSANEQLEEARQSLEAQKQQAADALEEERRALNERIEEERSNMQNELAAGKQSLSEERERFEEEMRARNSAYFTERDWREKDLAAREQLLEERRKEIETLQEEALRSAQQSQEEDESARAAEIAAFNERVRKFEEEEEARKRAIESEFAYRTEMLERDACVRREALEAEESERRRILDEEETERRTALDTEEATRREALEQELGARRQALDEEENERRLAMDAEEAQRRQALEEELARKDAEESHAQEELKLREQAIRDREAFYTQEYNRLTELLRQKDDTLLAERTAHAQELITLEKRIRDEQEEAFREREQELLHKNYRDLINHPAPAPEDGAQYQYYNTPVAPTEGAAGEGAESTCDYRDVVRNIYEGALNKGDRGDELAAAQPTDSMDFNPLKSRAARDEITIVTTGGKSSPKHKEESMSVVHKGKALFLSAIVVFCLCVIEGAVVFGLRGQYAFPVFYPYVIWGAGLILLLVTGLAYANRYGERSIRRNDYRIWINAIAIYVLLVIVTCIVALGVNIDFTSPSALATFIVVPVIFFFGIVVFGMCYYILTLPKKH